MSYGTFAGIVAGTGVTAMTLCLLLHTVMPRERFRRFHDVSYAVFLQLGVVFAVLLAFVFNDVWGGYQTAAEAINIECSSLHGLVILGDRLPAPQRAAVLGETRQYLTTVAEREWPDMEHRKSSAVATRQFEVLWGTVAALPSADAVARGPMLSLLARAHEGRETRLFQMTQGVPPLVWAMLSLFAAGLVGCMLVFAAEGSLIKAVFIGCFAGFLTVALLTVHILDYPFESALELSPADFQGTLAKVDAFLGWRHRGGSVSTCGRRGWGCEPQMNIDAHR